MKLDPFLSFLLFVSFLFSLIFSDMRGVNEPKDLRVGPMGIGPTLVRRVQSPLNML
jgi:hypothetical protein